MSVLPLSPVEQEFVDRIDATGEWIGSGYGTDSVLRAEVVRRAIIDPESIGCATRRSVFVAGTRISGVLDLDGVHTSTPVSFVRCYFTDEIAATDARFKTFAIDGSLLSEVHAARVRIEGAFRVTRSRILGGVLLRDADVVGTCDFDHSRFGDATALLADGARFGSDLFLRHVTTRGELRLSGSSIRGQLVLAGADVYNPGSIALNLVRSEIESDIFFSQGCTFAGEVDFTGARIRGDILGSGVQARNALGTALNLAGAAIEGTVDFRNSVVHGAINLATARVNSRVDLHSCEVAAPNGIAISLIRATVGDGVFMGEAEVAGRIALQASKIDGRLDLAGLQVRCPPGEDAVAMDGMTLIGELAATQVRAIGGLRLVAARIEGSVLLSATEIEAIPGYAIEANALEVQGSIALNRGFSATGRVGLVGAVVRDQIDASEASFAVRDITTACFSALSAHIGRDVYLIGTRVEGELNLSGAEVGGSVIIRVTDLGGDRFALDLERARIARTLTLMPRFSRTGAVDLRDAEIGSLNDGESAWTNAYYLDGLRFDRIHWSGSIQRDRRRWLAGRHDRAADHPYANLAEALTRAGSEEAARKIRIAREQELTKRLPRRWRPWRWIFGLAIGYGYAPGRAIAWFVAMVVAGSVIFELLFPKNFVEVGASGTGPSFVSPVYTLDVLVPALDFGQSSHWIANGPALLVSGLLTVLGWLLASTLVAAIAGVLGRR